MSGKKLKPFDLEAALSGEPVMLRDGSKAFVRHHETELTTAIENVLLGYIEGVGVWSWSADGTHSPGDESIYDIIGMYPTRIVNGFEVPTPETEVPASFTDYYVATPTLACLYGYETWNGHRIHRMWLERGLIFLNKEHAVANAKAMLGIDPDSPNMDQGRHKIIERDFDHLI